MAEKSKTEYFLKSRRLGFRRWTHSDLDLALSLWGNSSVTKLIGGPFSPEQISQRLKDEIRMQESWGIQYWPIRMLASDTFVGCCGLRAYKAEPGIREIGVHLLPEWSRLGIATEALRAVISYAFDELKLEALFAGHNPANEASKNLMTKLGFAHTHEELYEPTGLMHPSYLLEADRYLRRSGRD